ncbi:MAG: hypothetical protein JSW66_20015 [Phycisphaerales bacterium]|nr:MAG: hypothetical protein JSW66_20015 [Phycisphaerales bacterium]
MGDVSIAAVFFVLLFFLSGCPPGVGEEHVQVFLTAHVPKVEPLTAQANP